MQANHLKPNDNNDLKAPVGTKSEQILALKNAARKDGQNSQTLSKLGKLLIESQKFDEAVGVYQKIYDLEPQNPRNCNSLGVTLMIAGYQTQSIEYLEKAVSLAPDNFVFKANLGKAFMMARQWREALECIDHVLAMSGCNGSGQQLAALRQECLAKLPAASQETHDASGLIITEAEVCNSTAPGATHQKKALAVDRQAARHTLQESHEAASLSIAETGNWNRDAKEAAPKQDVPAPENRSSITNEAISVAPVDATHRADPVKAELAPNADNVIEILRQKKILHAPFEIAGNMARFVKYIRGKGIAADDANYYDTWLGYKNSISLNINKIAENERFKVVSEFAAQATDKYDIFHFHFGQSLYPDLRDLPELARRGKKILFSFWGSDQRAPEWIYYHQAKFLGYEPPKPFYLNKQLFNVHRTINMYADVIFGGVCLPRGLYYPAAIDINEWSLEEKRKLKDGNIISKDPDKIYIVHSPTSQWKKGTPIIVRMLNNLRQQGMPIEMMQVSGLEPQQAKSIYAHADFAVDQIGAGTFGLFALEMMSWQIPTMTYQVPMMDRIRDNPPVLKITADSLEETIQHCLDIKSTDEYHDLGVLGREWVAQHCDISVWLDKYLEIYSQVILGERVPQLINNSWFCEEARLLGGVKSDFYRYMIENNVFEQIGMSVPEYDSDLYT